MLDVLLTLCNLLALFVFLYTTAGLAVTGVAELLQLAVLGRHRPSEGLQDGELKWFVVPPIVTGAWLAVAWWFGWGTAIATAL